MYYSRLKQKNQVTLPAKIVKALHWAIGDTLEVQIDPNGNLLLKPKRLLDATDMWFISPEVQDALKHTFEDLKNGRIVVSDSADKMIENLDKGKGL